MSVFSGVLVILLWRLYFGFITAERCDSVVVTALIAFVDADSSFIYLFHWFRDKFGLGWFLFFVVKKGRRLFHFLSSLRRSHLLRWTADEIACGYFLFGLSWRSFWREQLFSELFAGFEIHFLFHSLSFSVASVHKVSDDDGQYWRCDNSNNFSSFWAFTRLLSWWR